ncbi:11273_t:CDS:2, partial [Dentiscutata erythropus]
LPPRSPSQASIFQTRQLTLQLSEERSSQIKISGPLNEISDQPSQHVELSENNENLIDIALFIPYKKRDTDLAGDDLDATSQEANNAFRDILAAYFQKKEKIESVLVDIFLLALESIEKKMDKSFSALYQEIEKGDLLDEKWPKFSLSKAHNQHEYDFLAKASRHLDKAIKGLLVFFRKKFAGVWEDVKTRAVMLRLANNRGWSAALQIYPSLVARTTIVGFVATSIREKGFLLLHQTLRKESLIREIKEKTKGFIPFMAEKDIALQDIKRQLPASTVEVLVTLPQAAHP